MTETVEAIKSQLRGLNSSEKAELVEFLLDSTEQDEIDQAWRTEISRRVADIRAGTATGRPLDIVVAELRERSR